MDKDRWDHLEEVKRKAAEESQVKYIIPENKVDDVKAYAAKLRRKFPHIAQHRLMKKVAAYYHLDTNQ